MPLNFWAHEEMLWEGPRAFGEESRVRIAIWKQALHGCAGDGPGGNGGSGVGGGSHIGWFTENLVDLLNEGGTPYVRYGLPNTMPGMSDTLTVEDGAGNTTHTGTIITSFFDVFVEFSAPVTLAAAPDTSGAALVDGGPRLLPAAELLVSGGAPQARSGWYDSGTQRPEWREAIVVTAGTPGAPAFVVEFQTAAGSADGGADADRASEWSATLGDLPSLRYARFRVRFAGLGLPGRSARIDRIVLPYED